MNAPTVGAQPDSRLPFLVGAALKTTNSMGAKSATAGNGYAVEWELPPNGYLQELEIAINGVIGICTNPNPEPTIYGNAALIKSISLVAGGTITIFQMDGVGYYYGESQANGQWNLDDLSTAFVEPASAGIVTLPIIIRPTINRRDLQGLLPVASHETSVILRVEFNAPSTISADFTWSTDPVVTPYPTWYTRPDPRQYAQPPLDSIVSTIMTRETPTGADWRYEWPRNGIYAQMVHIYGGLAVDQWDTAEIFTDKVNSQFYMDPNLADIKHRVLRGRARRKGLIVFDLLGATGDGDMGSASGVLSSRRFNVAETVFSLNTTGQALRHIRKQIVPINGRGGW